MQLLCVLFFLSGAAGLIYQVVWVRQFANVFGSTVYSASLVTGIFMLGLGLGSYGAGRWVDRRHASNRTGALRAYGIFELGIAALGLALAWVVPQLESVSAALTTYQTSSEGWFELSTGSSLLRYLIAGLLLAPITGLMGGTLTLLVRHVLTDHLADSGWRVGLLYGANTAGAALGAISTDLLLIPSQGLWSTQSLAALFNLLAGLGALRMAKAAQTPADTQSPVSASPPPEPESGSKRNLSLVAIAIGFSGFAGLAIEIVWFRHLISVLGGYRAVFSVLLFVILTGTWLGAVAGGFWHRRVGRPGLGYAWAQAALVASALILLARLDREEVLARGMEAWLGAQAAPDSVRRWVGFWTNLRVAITTVGPPSFCMGMAYPLANALVQRASGSVGTRAGALYLANTCGAVLGAITTGFLFLPAIGTQASASLAMAAAAVPLLLMAALKPPLQRSEMLAWVGAMLIALVALAGWLSIPADRLLYQSLTPDDRARLVQSSEGIGETISILDAPMGRVLSTNGHNMSANTPAAQRYMRAFVHIPLLHLDQPQDALVICFGVGTTLHAASLYDELERIEVVDISRHVLQHAGFFADSNHGVLAHPRVHVFVNDGRQHLRTRPAESYDLITSEPPPIAHAGVAGLYSVEYYTLAKSRLRPGGFISQWLPAYQQTSEVVRQIIKAFVEVFPNAILLSGVEKELILLASKETPLQLSPEDVHRRLAARPAVKRDLEGVLLGDAIELFGAFIADGESLAQLTAGDEPVTDDFPILEYNRYSNLLDVRLPDGLFATERVGSWCPRCLVPESELRELLLAYLSVRNQIYRSERFMRTLATGPAAAKLSFRRGSPEYEAIMRSRYLQSVLGGARTSTSSFQIITP